MEVTEVKQEMNQNFQDEAENSADYYLEENQETNLINSDTEVME